MLLTLHIVSLNRVGKEYEEWLKVLSMTDLTNLVMIPQKLIYEQKAEGLLETYKVLGSTIQFLYNHIKKFKGANVS